MCSLGNLFNMSFLLRHPQKSHSRSAIPDSPPFSITVFEGKMKADFAVIGKNLVKQVKDLMYEETDRGRHIAMERGYYVKIRLVRADTPARHFAKGTKHHSGYGSCERCTVKGKMCRGPADPEQEDPPVVGEDEAAAGDAQTSSGKGKKPGGGSVVFPDVAEPRKMKDWKSYMAPKRKPQAKRRRTPGGALVSAAVPAPPKPPQV